MEILLQLFISFTLIGLGAYGGGLVTIPLIQHELVTTRHWLGFEEMARIFAIAQMTPGPIAINAATFTGYRLSGIFGALTTTIAVILPAIIILIFLMPWIEKFHHNRHFNKFKDGLQIGVLSLILYAVWSYGNAALKGWVDLVIAIIAFLILYIFEGKLHPIVVILAGGIIGIFIF
jgi:chromate transporter